MCAISDDDFASSPKSSVTNRLNAYFFSVIDCDSVIVITCPQPYNGMPSARITCTTSIDSVAYARIQFSMQ